MVRCWALALYGGAKAQQRTYFITDHWSLIIGHSLLTFVFFRQDALPYLHFH